VAGSLMDARSSTYGLDRRGAWRSHPHTAAMDSRSASCDSTMPRDRDVAQTMTKPELSRPPKNESGLLSRVLVNESRSPDRIIEKKTQVAGASSHQEHAGQHRE
jgi:hypothetical protein